MEPGAVRAIEYDTVASEEVACEWLDGPIDRDLRARFKGREVAIVRCVDAQGEKLTALTDAEHFKQLLGSGIARDPKGMALVEREFPVVYPGWVHAGWRAYAPICRRRGCLEEATEGALMLCDFHRLGSLAPMPSVGPAPEAMWGAPVLSEPSQTAKSPAA